MERTQLYLDRHRSFREKISHEDTLVNYRTTWLLVFQTLLFGSLTLFLDKFSGYGGAPAITGVLVFLGIASAVATFLSVQAAFEAIQSNVDQWNENLHEERDLLPPVAGGGNNAGIRFRGRFFALSIPLFFCISWLLIAVILVSFGLPDVPGK